MIYLIIKSFKIPIWGKVGNCTSNKIVKGINSDWQESKTGDKNPRNYNLFQIV